MCVKSNQEMDPIEYKKHHINDTSDVKYEWMGAERTLEIIRRSVSKHSATVLSIGVPLTSRLVSPTAVMTETSSATLLRGGAPIGPFAVQGMRQLNLILLPIIFFLVMELPSNSTKTNIK